MCILSITRDITERKRQETALLNAHAELEMAYDATLQGWVKALEMREKETANHSRRVVDMTLKIAAAVGIAEDEMIHIKRGAMLHDIGKMGVPDHILLKPGPLTSEEWQIMRLHPNFAYSLLSEIDYLLPAIDIPFCHHEKWNGSGYPRGLKGTQIPLPARIFAIIDVFDALISSRPYRPAWSEKQAMDYIREQGGTHFDPDLIDIFMIANTTADILVDLPE
jgi:HD-GYP domain-containing protein (c-di-GMP phosphodiesterase class II)